MDLFVKNNVILALNMFVLHLPIIDLIELKNDKFVQVLLHLMKIIYLFIIKRINSTYIMDKKIEQVNFLLHIDKLNQYKKNNNSYLLEKIDHK